MRTDFYFTGKAPFVLEIFKSLYFRFPLFFLLSAIAEFLKKYSDSKNLTSTLFPKQLSFFNIMMKNESARNQKQFVFRLPNLFIRVFSKAIHHLAIFKEVFKLFYSIFNFICKFQNAGPERGIFSRKNNIARIKRVF